jgi:hypothetical protein
MLIDPSFVPKSSSPLGRQHFQNAYVTTDLEQAITLFREQYGIGEFHLTRDFALPMGGVIDIALAWAGNMNFELIWPRGNRNSLYERLLPEAGFAVRFHHMGYVIPDRGTWNDLVAEIERSRREIVFSGVTDGLDWIYIEAPELGHYLEYILPEEAWIERFDVVPHY